MRAIAALAEDLGIRAVARVFDVEANTVLAWLRDAGDHAEAVSEFLLTNLSVEQVQLDKHQVWLGNKSYPAVSGFCGIALFGPGFAGDEPPQSTHPATHPLLAASTCSIRSMPRLPITVIKNLKGSHRPLAQKPKTTAVIFYPQTAKFASYKHHQYRLLDRSSNKNLPALPRLNFQPCGP